MYIILLRNVDMYFLIFVLKDLILFFFCVENYYKMWIILDKNWMVKLIVYSERFCLWIGLYYIFIYYLFWNFLDFNNLYLFLNKKYFYF